MTTLVPPPDRIAADIGNSRMKWASFGPAGRITRRATLNLDDPASWLRTLRLWKLEGRGEWAVSTVNPPIANQLDQLLRERSTSPIRWYRSASDVPVTSNVTNLPQAGADRALAALAATGISPRGIPGLVISCGTAITLERIAADGCWEGGAIAPGLPVLASSLSRSTAQLPIVAPTAEPPAWGPDTKSAIEAGVFWGTVGIVRELVERHCRGDSPRRWRIWTGGDASWLAPLVEEGESIGRVVPDLVLIGLGMAAFGITAESLVS